MNGRLGDIVYQLLFDVSNENDIHQTSEWLKVDNIHTKNDISELCKKMRFLCTTVAFTIAESLGLRE